jgi:hypothetical protein
MNKPRWDLNHRLKSVRDSRASSYAHDSNVNTNKSKVTTEIKEAEVASAKAKTYNRRDSQMVTHSSTSRPVQCLCMAERTGCPVFTDLWSYVHNVAQIAYLILVTSRTLLLIKNCFL